METRIPFAVTDLIRLIAVVGAFAAMLIGLALVFSRLKAKQQGFGPGSLRAIAMVLFIPVLLILPLIVPQFQTETLAALLGTVAGYVLSKTDDKE